MTVSIDRLHRTAPPPDRQEASSPWPGMGAVVVTSIAAMTPAFAVAALATPIERDMGISGTVFGLALSGFFAVSALAAPLARRLAARTRVPLLLAVINTVAVAALLLAAVAPGPAVLSAALLLAGAGNALTQPVAGRYIAARVPPGRLSLATGLTSAALGAAPLLPGLLAALVAGPHGWSVALAVAAVLPLLSLLVTPLARIGRDAGTAAQTGPETAAQRPADVEPSPGIGRVLLLWTIAAALATIGTNAAASYFVQLGTHSGLSTAAAGLMQSLAAVVAIAVRLSVGAVADRAPRRNPAVAGAMMLSGTIGLALISLGTPVTFLAGALLAVAGGWGWTGLLLAAVMRLLPGQGAKAGATIQIGLFGGAAIAPLAFGAATTALGISATVLLAALVVAGGIGSLVAGMRLLRRA
jgi:predicted MFS family arabinose efflux permease